MGPLRSEPSRFFDGDVGAGSTMRIELRRVGRGEPVAGANRGEVWQMRTRLGYIDRGFEEPFLVPDDTETFCTDLTSVPQLFTWLVPKSGTHLPAALLHDGLVTEPGETRSYIGPEVSRIQADRVFRDAMADLGTPIVRRWLVWAAVSLASVKTVRPRVLGWAMYAAIAVIGVLGVLATLDLFDWIDWVPWMGDRPWGMELLLGAAVAVGAPFVLAVPWAFAKLYRAGVIVGLALATLLHVTLAVAAVAFFYAVLERFASAVIARRLER